MRARTALTVIRPLAEKRVGMDALIECLLAVLCACADWTTSANDAHQDDLTLICSTVVGSYSSTLGNFGNNKKVNICIERWPSVLTCIVAVHNHSICSLADLDPRALLAVDSGGIVQHHPATALCRALHSRYRRALLPRGR